MKTRNMTTVVDVTLCSGCMDNLARRMIEHGTTDVTLEEPCDWCTYDVAPTADLKIVPMRVSDVGN